MSMFRSADERKHVSLMLSEVLDDIGVNDKRRMIRRRASMLIETIQTIHSKQIGRNNQMYLLGSRSEGTTTFGLKSDIDMLCCVTRSNVIQDLSEWEDDKTNYLMIQNENTTPGYCFLQLFNHDKRPATVMPKEGHITDGKGRILHTNTLNYIMYGYPQDGPSFNSIGPKELNDSDFVVAYPCKSWPKSAASSWLKRISIGKWPTQEIRRKAAKTACFVVPNGSKISKYPELEWRISTSLAERCLMFDLNITQIKCYTLMKMILKCFLNPQGEINISSFMCKTVLLHCIENKKASIWEENNLLECLKYCLIELNSCVQNDNLPHFFIPENNLMAGQFTAETKPQLLRNIRDFKQNEVNYLFKIDIDNLGYRLRVKLNLVTESPLLVCCTEDCKIVSATNCLEMANIITAGHFKNLIILHSADDKGNLKQALESLMTCKNNDNELEHTAFEFLAPLYFATYGSTLASESIGLRNQVSPQAFVWLLDGLDSDILSGRLKFASVFYSTGDMEKTELILRQAESKYKSYPVIPICGCFNVESPVHDVIKFAEECVKQNEDCFKNMTAFCVIFLKQEINCVPHELKYEMFRSTHDDMEHRVLKGDLWMDFSIVDSQPFLYFLQYKVYRHLKRYQDQQQALSNLANIIETEKKLRHKETALNILGQCMEQENRPKQALQCYLLSLQQRARNNVANIHICRLLSSLLVGQEN